MKHGQREVIDLYIFDESGVNVAVLDTLKNSKLITSDDEPVLYVNDSLLDEDLLDFITTQQEDNRTDYEKFFDGGSSLKTVVFNKKNKKKCKLIAQTVVRGYESGMDKYQYFEIPNAEIVPIIDFESCSCGDPSEYNLTFSILPFNDNEDLFKIHTEQDQETGAIDNFISTLSAMKKDITGLKDQKPIVYNITNHTVSSFSAKKFYEVLQDKLDINRATMKNPSDI